MKRRDFSGLFLAPFCSTNWIRFEGRKSAFTCRLFRENNRFALSRKRLSFVICCQRALRSALRTRYLRPRHRCHSAETVVLRSNPEATLSVNQQAVEDTKGDTIQTAGRTDERDCRLKTTTIRIRSPAKLCREDRRLCQIQTHTFGISPNLTTPQAVHTGAIACSSEAKDTFWRFRYTLRVICQAERT
jgi:hypothetical protein